MSERNSDLRHRVTHNFAQQPVHGDQPEQYERLRTAARDLALLLLDLTPPSREQSLALTHLEEATFWACASIARNT